MTDNALPPLLEALRFSIADTLGQTPREMTAMHAWLATHPEAWRLTRLDLVGEDRRLSGGSILVTGEAGCGKTTVLAEEADYFRQSRENFVAHVNFLDAERINLQTRTDDLLPRLGAFLTAQIERAIARYDHDYGLSLWDDYQSARIREIIGYEGADFLSQAKDKYYSAIDDMAIADIRADELLQRAHETFRRNRPEMMIGYRAIQRTWGPKRIVIILDNLDNIGGKNAATCLGDILRLKRSKTLIYCALRSENEYAISYLNAFMSDRVYVSVPDLAKLLTIRTRGVSQFHISEGKKIPRGLTAISNDALRAMSKLQRDRNGARILEKWHNSNIRLMLTFVTVNRQKLAHARSATELHGALLSALIWNVDAHGDLLLSLLNPSDNSAANLPFMFLKLRILAYLRKHGPECERKRLVLTLAKYNVDPHEVKAALGRLAAGTLVNGAFIRIAPDAAGNEQVTLLPAGDLFLCEMAYSVEFLGYQEEKRGGKQAFDPAARLYAASEFVKNRLVPAFRQEHPYTRGNVLPRPTDQTRLRNYRRDFGYATDQWFITGLARSLEGYARVNGYITEQGTAILPGISDDARAAVERMNEALAQIHQMERALDTVLKADLGRNEVEPRP